MLLTCSLLTCACVFGRLGRPSALNVGIDRRNAESPGVVWSTVSEGAIRGLFGPLHKANVISSQCCTVAPTPSK